MNILNNKTQAQVSDLLFVRTTSMTCNDCDKCGGDCADPGTGHCKCEDN